MTTPIYTRSKYQEKILDPDGETTVDPLNFKFDSFINFLKNKKRVKIRKIKESEEGQPDLISYEEYGSEQYWWIILYVNNIIDPINEFVAGLDIAIPLLSDIEEFRQSQNSNASGKTVILN